MIKFLDDKDEITSFKEAIKKAKNKKALNKILKQAKTQYNFLSSEYIEILNLCWDRLESLNNK